jgi:hypothetical protein
MRRKERARTGPELQHVDGIDDAAIVTRPPRLRAGCSPALRKEPTIRELLSEQVAQLQSAQGRKQAPRTQIRQENLCSR